MVLILVVIVLVVVIVLGVVYKYGVCVSWQQVDDGACVSCSIFLFRAGYASSWTASALIVATPFTLIVATSSNCIHFRFTHCCFIYLP